MTIAGSVLAMTGGPPSTIYIVRHGEKPEALDQNHPPASSILPELKPPTMGVDAQGNIVDPDPTANPSLTVRGWQRAGALAVLFGRMPDLAGAPVLRPDALVAAGYDAKHHSNETDVEATDGHRPYETIEPLAEVLALNVYTDCRVGHEAKAMAHVLAQRGTVLIAWEHHHIYAAASGHDPASGLVASLEVTNPDDLPPKWGDRFDQIWCFERDGSGATEYHFRLIPQRLLAGDGS